MTYEEFVKHTRDITDKSRATVKANHIQYIRLAQLKEEATDEACKNYPTPLEPDFSLDELEKAEAIINEHRS